MSENIKIKVDQAKLEQMKTFYKDFLIPNDGEYIYFFAEVNGIQITGYESKKDAKTVLFKGKDASKEASIWSDQIEESTSKKTTKTYWLDLNNQMGSDEVGVGDFLGPLIVVATYIKKDDIQKLIDLGVKDSKKLNDEKIMEIAPKILKFVEYSKLTLNNEKYNELALNNENLNSMKAKMHNRVLLNLKKKHPNLTHIYIDEFVNEKKYYSYLNDENEPQVKGITFKTKGESYYPCVAASSIIARYAFLLEMKKLNEKYNMLFPLGAGKSVDVFSINFIKKFGLAEFNKICKKNFKNYNNIINQEN